MKHLGSLESTHEARVALSYASSNSYASFKGSMIQQPSTCLLSYRNITDKKMTEMGLQCYFHNMNTGTTAEPTLPTASFSFHIKKSDDQSITLSHCQGFLSHKFFLPTMEFSPESF